jgi:hypothetical protein
MEEEKELKKGQKAYLKRIVNQFQEEAKKSLDSIENLKLERKRPVNYILITLKTLPKFAACVEPSIH